MTVIRFTNCRVCEGEKLISQKDIVFEDTNGKILDEQSLFFGAKVAPERVVDMGGRILAPGFIEIQINGGTNGFDYAVFHSDSEYEEGVRACRKHMVKYGVTALCPTVVSATREIYAKVLHHLRPTLGSPAEDGADILGVHVEGPFISLKKSGCHPIENFREPQQGFQDLVDMYGTKYLDNGTIKIITAAPELPHMLDIISECALRNIVYSIGHTAAVISQAEAAVRAGATCITHLFNAMPSMHHRDPGVIGLIGSAEKLPRPYYGIICDDIHIHRSSVKLAYRAHPKGAILVSDAMGYLDCEDGLYDWRCGKKILKNDDRLIIDGTDTIAGSVVGLDQCVRNLIQWTAADLPQAVACVTEHPAELIGIGKCKGFLRPGCDADFVILDDEGHVLQTWKQGKMVYGT